MNIVSKDGMGSVDSDTTDAAAMAKRDAQPSRRSLFTSATTACAGFAALFLLGTRKAHATEGGNVVIGFDNVGDTTTTIENVGTGYGLQGTSSDPSGAGIYGLSSGSNPGVVGVGSGTGPGVVGNSSGSGAGVLGNSTAGGSGPGVQAMQSPNSTGMALAVFGPVTFSSSGVATIPAGMDSVIVPVAGMTPASMVLATLQGIDKGNNLEGVLPETNQFTIQLRSNAPSSGMPIAWFVISASA